jgi:hypothetical protein
VIEGYNSLPPPTSSSYEATFASANLPSLPTQLNDTSNTASLHTVSTCSLRKSGLQTGTTETTICDAAANMNSVRRPSDRSKHRSCQSDTFSACLFSRVVVSGTAGNGWNSGGGGYYVLWRDTQRSGSIKIYTFPRSSNAIPADLLAQNGSTLSPRDWTVTPAANFSIPQCANSTFNSHAVVINTALCGDLAGNTWGASGCDVASATCAQFVKETPAAFADAYWGIRSLRIYTRSSHLHVSFRGSIWPWLTSDDALDISVVQIHCPFDRSSHARLFCYRRAWTCTSLDLVRLHPARCKADSSSNRLLLYYLPKYTRCGLCSVDSAFPRCFVSRPLSRPPRMQAVGSSWGRKGRLGA